VKIVLAHYHLRPGGVTQVVFNQARALRESGEDVLVLSGESPPLAELWNGIPISVVPGLHYDRFRPPESGIVHRQTRAEKLALGMEAAIRSHWPGASAGAGEVLVHVHNPLIRKNSLLIGALKKIAGSSPLLLQNHDLAEDFRPDVYSGEAYPANCHYGVINSRDYRFLLEAGLKPEGLHLLPNEVRPLRVTSGLPRGRYVYPVRGIRRKNIGEALFLSIFSGAPIAITQPPTTEQDMPIYSRWKATAAELSLPVEFEAGLAASFADVMGSARAVITTSVKEGFGFSFLEPWTAGIPVAGRRIDYVCRDFEASGVRMDNLYPALNIPAEYARPEQLKAKMESALNRLYAAFSLPLPPQVLQQLDNVFTKDWYDFGIMDEELQETLVRLASKDKAVRRDIVKANPFLETLFAWRGGGNSADMADKIEDNRRAVLSAYSRETILGTILGAYNKTLAPVAHSISRERLLDMYLDPARLSLAGISPPDAPGEKPA
jgi:glycosyltransferase involved in cell wall biosynthesis